MFVEVGNKRRLVLLGVIATLILSGFIAAGFTRHNWALFSAGAETAAPAQVQQPTIVQPRFANRLIAPANDSGQEDCPTVPITVNRVGDTSMPATVDYFTADITASSRQDYITALGKLRFAAGETSKTFAVLINEDSYVEGNETFSVNLI